MYLNSFLFESAFDFVYFLLACLFLLDFLIGLNTLFTVLLCCVIFYLMILRSRANFLVLHRIGFFFPDYSTISSCVHSLYLSMKYSSDKYFSYVFCFFFEFYQDQIYNC